jgi:isopentenyl-diphosphate delta-isomerase
MAVDPELVVLVDDSGNPLGTAEKRTVHGTDTPLHLAYSCHVFDGDGRVLVTRRALSKLTWPGVWTNSFCGHQVPGASVESAVTARAIVELGIAITGLEPVLPDFRYRAIDASGIVENEICPVFSAVTTDAVAPNPEEVAEWKWVAPEDLRTAVAAAPYAFSPWLVLQLNDWALAR